MNISSKGHYALQAIFDLASRNTAEPVKIASIAQRQNIPQKFLELILSSLKQGGFVESRRGADGGYPGAASGNDHCWRGPPIRRRPARETEGPRHETPFSELWRNVDKSVAGIVDRANFASIIRNWAEKQKTYVHDWDI